MLIGVDGRTDPGIAQSEQDFNSYQHVWCEEQLNYYVLVLLNQMYKCNRVKYMTPSRNFLV